MKRALFLFPLLLISLSAHAQEASSSIAAVVNDAVISTLDVEQRTKLVLITTRLPDTPEVRARIAPQIIRNLVDEALQKQAAAREGIEITEADVQEAIATLEKQRSMEPGSLIAKLQEAGVPRTALPDQLRPQLAWNQYMLQVVRPKAKLSEEEIERERARLRQPGVKQAELEIMVLPVPKPEQETQVKALVEKLAAEIRKGASFADIARQLGAPESAAAGLKPMMVPFDRMEPPLAKAVEAAAPNDVLEPVRTTEGYVLARLLSRKDPTEAGKIQEVLVKEVIVPNPPTPSAAHVQAVQTLGQAMAMHAAACPEQIVPNVTGIVPEQLRIAVKRAPEEQLPEGLRGWIAALKPGGVAAPMAAQDGTRIYQLCERTEKAALADREETMQRLFAQKMELESKKALRQLRREATVEVRER